ncbi:MAG: DUF3488 and transglutaminase-like domain-containing protein [Pyrinomonadaceae bacterium MAG19_C2-C3]|nr:DUF3488 and transglutaminase-like domain-containing protein [Pyrinomonadaceae bacterium MAG19_C2-C3]
MSRSFYSRAISYGTIGAALALMLSAAGFLTVYSSGILLGVLCAAWLGEDFKWQVGKFVGAVVVITSLASYVFYLFAAGDFSFASFAGRQRDSAIYLMLWVVFVRLFQRKSERDWLALHLLTFASALLALGLNVTAQSGVIMLVYLFASFCVWISRQVNVSASRAENAKLVKPLDASKIQKHRLRASPQSKQLFAVSLCIVLLIVGFAMPIFLTAPRITESALASLKGRGSVIGFTDSISLGSIGQLQQSNQIVMRVRVDNAPVEINGRLRWRGTAFDFFDGREWKRSNLDSNEATAVDDKLFRIGTTRDVKRLVRQTFYVEPTDTPVLFAASRLVAIEGELPFVVMDAEGGAQSASHLGQTLSYRAYSDVEDLSGTSLAADLNTIPDAYQRYLQLPANFDSRITQLADNLALQAGAQNNYERARSFEAYLKNEFKYSFEMRAEGQDPVADFLFRVREGHCEYFASAMALMLRAQGIPSRVVVGYQGGEYNEAANAYTVRQREAHSWVEAYFPQNNSWMTFDPTPVWYSPSDDGIGNAWFAQLKDYVEAFDLVWAQYVVSYGKQEQQWLAGSLREGLGEQRRMFARRFNALSENLRRKYESFGDAIPETRDADGVSREAMLLIGILMIAVMIFLVHRIYQRRNKTVAQKSQAIAGSASLSVSPLTMFEFYTRMTTTLKAQGFERKAAETPAEFAATLKIPAASVVTNAFERARYGGEILTANEAKEIEDCLRRLEVTGDDGSDGVKTVKVGR